MSLEAGRYVEWSDKNGDRGFLRISTEGAPPQIDVTENDGSVASVFVDKKTAKKIVKALERIQ